ncbi:hypothetical protein AYO44_14285 [Planctomycetaceae bacterium SCGC AG-212-F19]|nr:hypothetical protein AYO44_14285 [Planctomycetaceae bacterium SCGC AG-212-F19]
MELKWRMPIGHLRMLGVQVLRVQAHPQLQPTLIGCRDMMDIVHRTLLHCRCAASNVKIA